MIETNNPPCQFGHCEMTNEGDAELQGISGVAGKLSDTAPLRGVVG